MLSAIPVASVQHAFLPVALRGASADGDLARAGLLVDSLERCWRDAAPLRLVVVCPDEDLTAVSEQLKSTPRIDVAHYDEGAFLPPNSDFYRMPGWWKQQFLKLYVPSVLNLGAYITLDSDIVCCRPFTGTTFVQAGKLISQWEYKACQEWWRNIAEVRGCPVRRAQLWPVRDPQYLSTPSCRAKPSSQ